MVELRNNPTLPQHEILALERKIEPSNALVAFFSFYV